MFEFAILLILALILLALRNLKHVEPPQAPFYFYEENQLAKVRGRSGELQFYTVAEFDEEQTIGAHGLEKHLGFSEFCLVYDTNSEKIKTARVAFTAADGYRRSWIIGRYKPLNTKKIA